MWLKWVTLLWKMKDFYDVQYATLYSVRTLSLNKIAFLSDEQKSVIWHTQDL